MTRAATCYFLSGAAALVYQVVWARLLARVLGSDAAGVALVLCVYMLGLGLGARLAAGPARRAPRPQVLLAGLQAFCAVWAVASSLWLPALEPARELWARILGAGLCLLPPTLAMGATFPVMGRLSIDTAEQAGRDTARFYGANTLGAAAGALFGTFACMPALGLSRSLWAAAGIELVAAALARTLRAPAPACARARSPAPDARLAPALAPEPARARSSSPGASARSWPLLAAAACLGCTSLALEVLLTRLLSQATGTSTYAFALVLACFLLGIALGSARAAGAMAGGRSPESLALASAALLPLACFAGLLALRWQLGEPSLFLGLKNRLPGAEVGIARLWLMHAFLAALALIPPALCSGAALPALAGAVCKRGTNSRESALARVYAWNTAGAVLGSLGAGFWLLPSLGLRWSVAAALVPCVAAWLLIAPTVEPRRNTWRLCAGALAASVAAGAWLLVMPPRGGIDARAALVVVEDRDATILVEQRSVPGVGDKVRTLYVNGNPEASSHPVDARLQLLLGAIPGLLHGKVERACVIGLGSGMTAGALLSLSSHAPPEHHQEVLSVQALTVFELSRGMQQAARLFGDLNQQVVDDARTDLIHADGRHALSVSTAIFDLITADPIHPWTRGANDLYSLEHFRSMRAHLAPGGVASQWLPLYQISERDARLVIATWCAAFPRVSAWLTAYDLALVGSLGELPGERGLVLASAGSRLRDALARAGVNSAAELEALQIAGDAELRAYAAGIEPMRDDRPVLEFRAPLSYLAGYATEVLRWAGRPEYVARIPERARVRAGAVRALLMRFLGDLPRGKNAAIEAYGRGLLALPPLHEP